MNASDDDNDNSEPMRLWLCTATRPSVDFLVAARTLREAADLAHRHANEAVENACVDNDAEGDVDREITNRKQLGNFTLDYDPWGSEDWVDDMPCNVGELLQKLEEYKARKAAKAAYEAAQLKLDL